MNIFNSLKPIIDPNFNLSITLDDNINEIIDESIDGDSCNNYDIGKIFHYIYKDFYKYDDINNKWFININGNWIYEANTFNIKIPIYIGHLYKLKKSISNDPFVIKKLKRYIDHLKNRDFRLDVITECKEVFVYNN